MKVCSGISSCARRSTKFSLLLSREYDDVETLIITNINQSESIKLTVPPCYLISLNDIHKHIPDSNHFSKHNVI